MIKPWIKVILPSEEDKDRSGDCCDFTVDSNFIQPNCKDFSAFDCESSLIEGQ